MRHQILGEFKYELILKGIVSTQQRTIYFKCPLGMDNIQVFKFTHFLKKPSVYQVKLEKMEGLLNFKIDAPNVQAPAAVNNDGIEVSVNVKFEPNNIGFSKAILKLVSPENIEYSCILQGQSTAPQPQGPFKVALPGGKPLDGPKFKNPLPEKAEFISTFDNPCFSLANKPAGPLDPGKEMAF